MADWEKFDVAAYHLGVVLGIFPELDFKNDTWANSKHIFWSNNPLGESLHDILQEIVHIKMLEYDDGNPAYRWDVNFKISN